MCLMRICEHVFNAPGVVLMRICLVVKSVRIGGDALPKLLLSAEFTLPVIQSPSF